MEKNKRSSNITRKNPSTKTKETKNSRNVIDFKSITKDSSVIPNKRYRMLIMIGLILLVLLIMRLSWIQFVEGASLKERAHKQQMTDRIISPKRGTIYDTNMKPLAKSAPVDTVTINPKRIVDKKNDENKTKELKEKVAKAFSTIFELEYEDVLKKVSSTSEVETIIKKVEKDKIDKLKNWMEENKMYSGINIDEDSKRYYPYNNLASNLIGACGTDNQGLAGLEVKWKNVLTGTPGRIVTTEDAMQEIVPDKNEQYIPAENGSDIVLTLDANIQAIVEKHLKTAVQENNAARGGSIIMMKPSTGDILAMASYPTYDLNSPFTPYTDELKEIWDKLSSEEKTNQIYNSWTEKNTAVSYDPGSTFKLITAAVGLEEGITVPEKAGEFNCEGFESFRDGNDFTRVHCWSPSPHGNLSLAGALQKSCNPAFMQLGKKIGAKTLYKYYDAFGLFEKTGVEVAYESSSQFHKLDTIKEIEVATMSFGQGITITPIQLITAVSAIVNDGALMKPRLVKQIINTDTGNVTNIEPIEVRRVISKKTSTEMKEIMESVATIGTGKAARVTGYSVGGKSGTSEPVVGKEGEDGYIASYIAIAPTEKPEVCILVALYGVPKSARYQGGQIAAPVVSSILTEVLPNLGIPSDGTDLLENGNDKDSIITLPDITNKSVAEAEKILKDLGLTPQTSAKSKKDEIIVNSQNPKPGTTISKGSIIKVYTADDNAKISQEVPNLKEMSAAQAKNALGAKNLNIEIHGTGVVITQEPAAGSAVEEGSIVSVNLGDDLKYAY